MKNRRDVMCLSISVHKAAIKAAYCPFKMKQNRVNEHGEEKKSGLQKRT